MIRKILVFSAAIVGLLYVKHLIEEPNQQNVLARLRTLEKMHYTPDKGWLF